MRKKPIQRHMKDKKASFHEFLMNSVSRTNAKAIVRAFVAYKQGEVQAEEVTNLWLFRFKDYLIERGIAANSRAKYMSVLQSIIQRAINRGYECPCELGKIKGEMTVQGEASESVYVTHSELVRLWEYPPTTDVERFARAAFLIGCYTGARISDVITISESNINGTELLFNSKKTHSTSRVPLHPYVMELLPYLKGSLYDEDSIRVVVGREIKKICKAIGMTDKVTLYRRGQYMTVPKWQVISCHTSRKTFVTLLYLDGWKLAQISKMAGHSNTAMTEKYLCVSYNDEVTGRREFFKPDIDTAYNQLVKLIGLGLPVAQALGVMSINGAETKDIERVKAKFISENNKAMRPETHVGIQL